MSATVPAGSEPAREGPVVRTAGATPEEAAAAIAAVLAARPAGEPVEPSLARWRRRRVEALRRVPAVTR